MPTTVTLSPELAKFVDDLVQSGKFATHEEAVNDVLMRRKKEIEWLRAELKPAIEALGAFPKCDIFLADEEHHNLPPR